MRFGMNWPATRATYMGAPGCRQRQSGRIRRAWASASAGPSWGSSALRMASPIWNRLDSWGRSVRQHGQGKQVSERGDLALVGRSASRSIAALRGRFRADKGRRCRIVKVERRLRPSAMLRAPPSESSSQVPRRSHGAATSLGGRAHDPRSEAGCASSSHGGPRGSSVFLHARGRRDGCYHAG